MRALAAAGIPCALGGSGLLAALGLAERVGDWDLTTDAPARLVWPALDDGSLRYVGSDALHADEKVVLPDRAVEVICGFAFHVKGGIVRLPAVVAADWEGVPLASPEVWAVAYGLLGRTGKRDVLLRRLAERGADRALVRALLGQPLPEELRARLARLADPR